MLGVNGAPTARTGSEEKIAVFRRKDEAHRDALFRQFQQWDQDRNARAQVRPAPATAGQR